MIRGVRPVWAAFLLSIAGALTFLFAPLGTSVSSSPGPGGDITPATRHPNAVEIDGWWAAAPASIPVAVAGVPLAVKGRGRRPARVGAAVLLGVVVVLGIFSIGLFFVPAWIAMIVGATRPTPSRWATAS
jgi:hypothetical protein